MALAKSNGKGVAALRWLADAIFPPLCPSCAAPVAATGHLCAACWAGLTFLDGACCATCGLPFEVEVGADSLCGPCLAEPPAYERARAALRYDEAARGLILAFKHGDRLDMAPTFGRWLARISRISLGEVDLVAPVPLHRWRLLARRYNQAAVLAAALARELGAPHVPDLLARRRATPSQGGLDRAARRANVEGAFAVRRRCRAALKGRRVLLVDDVMTTGATVNACAKTLIRHGAASVAVAVIARPPFAD
ncbi:MAG: amidophosphoribosyltransferase [Proteobacteria bacterium]|nr:MAG: amidophosphoribosyltransferase [Pseudomonadota bacterium]